MNRCILFLVIGLMAGELDAQSLYEKGVFISEHGRLPYRILYPKDYDQHKQYPLILLLHGAGERGDNNESQLVHGSSLFASDSIRNNYPAIVIFPQCPTDSYWSSVEKEFDDGKREFNFNKDNEPTYAMKMLLDFVDSLYTVKEIDKQKMYVGGLSMGGMGTFELVYRRPDIFAAAFPICGGGDPDMVENYKEETVFWVFHGEADVIVPHECSDEMVEALQENGIATKYNLYPEVNHNSWDNAFREPELIPWLFSKSLNK